MNVNGERTNEVPRFLILLIILVVGIVSQPMLGNNEERLEKKDSRKTTVAVVTASAIAAATLACIIANQSCGKRILSFLKKKKHVKPDSEEIEKVLVSLGKQRHTPEFADELMENIPALTHNTALADEINELVEVGNLQEIIWRLREEGILDQADQLEKYLSDTLATAEIIGRRDIGVGQNNPQLVEFANGVRGVYKSGNLRGREIAMYRLDQLIGTNAFPVTVERTIDGKSGSMQLFIENAASASEIRKWKKTEDVPAISKEINTLRLLAHDWDRNANNFMYPTKGRAFAVDGENSFSNDSNGLSALTWQDLWEYFSASQGKKLEDVDIGMLRKKKTISVEGIHGYLTDPDFITRLGKITPEQADAVIAPIVESIAQGNDDIRRVFYEIIELQNKNTKGSHVKEIELAFDGVEDIYKKAYKHLSSEEILYKVNYFYKNIVDYNVFALTGLRQRMLDYAAVIKGTGDEVTTHP